MDIWKWLARCAAELRWRKAGAPKIIDVQKDKARAARALRTRLPAHLRRDIGADDG